MNTKSRYKNHKRSHTTKPRLMHNVYLYFIKSLRCHIRYAASRSLLFSHLTFFVGPGITRQSYSHIPGRGSVMLRALFWTMCRKIYINFYEKCNCVYQSPIPYIRENGYRITVRTQLHLCVNQLLVLAIYISVIRPNTESYITKNYNTL